MSDLSDLDDVTGSELTQTQLLGILAQIDLDILNLVRDGKLSALKYGIGGPDGRTTDRGANLKALLAARKHYQTLLSRFPAWHATQSSTE